MARSSSSFACQSCGAVHSKWSGRCDDCGAWNSLVEEGPSPPAGAGARRSVKGRRFALEGLATKDKEPQRLICGIPEFDRVAGGGLVPGSALLRGARPICTFFPVAIAFQMRWISLAFTAFTRWPPGGSFIGTALWPRGCSTSAGRRLPGSDSIPRELGHHRLRAQ